MRIKSSIPQINQQPSYQILKTFFIILCSIFIQIILQNIQHHHQSHQLSPFTVPNHNSHLNKKKQTLIVLTHILVPVCCCLFMTILTICIFICNLLKCPCLYGIFANLYHKQSSSQTKMEVDYIQEKDLCAICLTDGCDLILQCDHYFHLICFKQWMKRVMSCPMCKSKQINYLKVVICMKCKKNCLLVQKEKLLTFEIQEQCKCDDNEMMNQNNINNG